MAASIQAAVPHISASILPVGEYCLPTQLNQEIDCVLRTEARKTRYSLCQDDGHGIIKDTLPKQQGAQIKIHTQVWQKPKNWDLEKTKQLNYFSCHGFGNNMNKNIHTKKSLCQWFNKGKENTKQIIIPFSIKLAEYEIHKDIIADIILLFIFS